VLVNLCDTVCPNITIHLLTSQPIVHSCKRQSPSTANFQITQKENLITPKKTYFWSHSRQWFQFLMK
jgi:hypothetical protein